MPHVVGRPGLITGVRIAILLVLAHAVNDALTAILGALLLAATLHISSSVTQLGLGAPADRCGLRRVAAAEVSPAAVAFSLIRAAGTAPGTAQVVAGGGIARCRLRRLSWPRRCAVKTVSRAGSAHPAIAAASGAP